VAAFLCSSAPKKFALPQNAKYIAFGVLFQIAVVFAMTNVPAVVSALEYLTCGIMKLRDATLEGTKFVFGYVGGGDLPFDVKEGGSAFVFAFQALPTIILVGALGAILTYLRVLPFLSRFIGSIFRYIFGIHHAVGMVSAAKIFLGQLEAPLLIRPQLDRLSPSSFFIIVSLAFSTSSASVMPIYAAVLADICPTALNHIIAASVVGVISTLIVCLIMMPEENGVTVKKEVKAPCDCKDEKYYPNFLGAMSKGISDGVFVWACILGSLIGMVALISFVNGIFGVLPDIGGAPITLQRILGIVMYPVAYLIGIPVAEASSVAQILGTKIVLNEMIAFFDLAKANLSESSIITTIYAINNFGNFSCIGITVGGLSSLATGRSDIARLSLRAFVAGFLATGLSAAITSLFR
jgi:CNT family concentrative nucleoside transporter